MGSKSSSGTTALWFSRCFLTSVATENQPSAGVLFLPGSLVFLSFGVLSLPLQHLHTDVFYFPFVSIYTEMAFIKTFYKDLVSFNDLYACASVGGINAYECGGPHRPEGVPFPGAGVLGGCESYNTEGGDKVQVL